MAQFSGNETNTILNTTINTVNFSAAGLNSVASNLSVWARSIEKRYRAFNGMRIEIGVFDDQGAAITGTKLRLPALMRIHEFGAQIRITEKMRGFFLWRYGIKLREDKHFINIPARAPMRKSWDKNIDETRNMFEKGLAAIGEGKTTPLKVMIDVGEFLRQGVRDQILSGLKPTLWERRVGFSFHRTGLPLFDSGHLFKHIRFKIFKGTRVIYQSSF